MEQFDVCIIRGAVSVWSRGLFDQLSRLSLAPPQETVTIGRYRYYKEELDDPKIQRFISKHYPVEREEA